jgi:hypothetical protein
MYFMSRAYSVAQALVIAPFEYVSLKIGKAAQTRYNGARP